MSYKVAIVEDMPSEAQTLTSHFARYGEEHGLSFFTTVFPTAEAFLIDYRSDYDLVMMDICLPHMNGMEAARSLRKQDPVVPLVFVTTMAQFAVESYEVEALDFILKPVSYAAFSLKMQRVASRLKQKESSLMVIATGNEMHRIPVSQLKYVEIHAHDLIYHTDKGAITSYGNLKQVEEKLDPSRFVRCNSCYLVNLEYVRSVLPSSILVGNEELAMSRPKRKEFVHALNMFLGGGE